MLSAGICPSGRERWSSDGGRTVRLQGAVISLLVAIRKLFSSRMAKTQN
jgi:hypothetical protein